MKISKELLLVLVMTSGLSVAVAHHSPFLFFDPSQTVEIEGVVKKVTWRNPHASFVVEAEGPDGNLKDWNIEANSVSILQRMNLTRDSVQPGDEVRIAGWPGKKRGADIFVINMLLPEGREIVFMPGLPARWATEQEGDTGNWLVTEADIDQADNSNGIFQTWSTSFSNIEEALMFDGSLFPLTEEAATARAGYDLYDSPIFEGSCVHKGMPTIMEQPYPIEFVDNGDTVTLRMEEGDAVREIVMGEAVDVSGRPPVEMGYSFGSWDGDTLVVTTTRSSWPYTDMTGVPNSPDAVYVERFVPSPDGKRMDYQMTVTEPALFTEPFSMGKAWLHIPGDEVRPYDCASAE